MAESSQTNNLKYIALLIVPLVLIAVFLAGVEYQKHHMTTTVSNANAAAGNNAFGAGGGRRGLRGANGQVPVIGNVTAVTSSSLSIQTRQGATDTVNVSISTQIFNGQSTAQLSDIQTGDRVLILGTTGTNNTITATRINVNPTFGGSAGASTSGGPATQTN